MIESKTKNEPDRYDTVGLFRMLKSMSSPVQPELLRSTIIAVDRNCDICHSVISGGSLAFVDEFVVGYYPRDNLGPVQVRHTFCATCVRTGEAAHWIEPSFHIPVVIPPRVEWVDVTPQLVQRLQINWLEIYEITDEQFERLIADRLQKSGCTVQLVGRTNKKDGGVDIVFATSGAWPTLGACQVKHHRSPKTKTGPKDVRDLAGVLATHPFQLGVLVTNTCFTPDAKWFARNHGGFLKLRDGDDLKLWVQDKFVGNEHWRPTPTTIELCPGVTIEIPIFR